MLPTLQDGGILNNLLKMDLLLESSFLMLLKVAFILRSLADKFISICLDQGIWRLFKVWIGHRSWVIVDLQRMVGVLRTFPWLCVVVLKKETLRIVGFEFFPEKVIVNALVNRFRFDFDFFVSEQLVF